MSKRIGIDARWITPEISGIGRYTEELIEWLAKLDRENEYVLFFSDREAMGRVMGRVAANPRFSGVFFPRGPFSPWGQLLMPRLIRKHRLDLFHSPNFMIPLRTPRRVKVVATVHDLIPLLFPEMTPRALKTRLYPLYSFLMKRVIRRADLLIAVSDHSRRDLLRKFGLSESKVARVYNGVEKKYVPVRTHRLPESYKSVVGIHGPYFLYVGRHDPYKNILGLVQAYAKFLDFIARPEGPKQSQEIPQLVITGKRDSRYPEAYRWCEQNGLMGKVVFAGFVVEDELVSLYQHALAVVLVSRYEGFGLPALEAMACGVPVLASDAASIPEVVGMAALKVHADSVEEIAAGLTRLYTDSALRQSLQQLGVFQAQKFSWESTARETLKAYLNCLN